jgi:hypothetical protein
MGAIVCLPLCCMEEERLTGILPNREEVSVNYGTHYEILVCFKILKIKLKMLLNTYYKFDNIFKLSFINTTIGV